MPISSITNVNTATLQGGPKRDRHQYSQRLHCWPTSILQAINNRKSSWQCLLILLFVFAFITNGKLCFLTGENRAIISAVFLIECQKYLPTFDFGCRCLLGWASRGLQHHQLLANKCTNKSNLLLWNGDITTEKQTGSTERKSNQLIICMALCILF